MNRFLDRQLERVAKRYDAPDTDDAAELEAHLRRTFPDDHARIQAIRAVYDVSIEDALLMDFIRRLVTLPRPLRRVGAHYLRARIPREQLAPSCPRCGSDLPFRGWRPEILDPVARRIVVVSAAGMPQPVCAAGN
jgi:hypothetical protein